VHQNYCVGASSQLKPSTTRVKVEPSGIANKQQVRWGANAGLNLVFQSRTAMSSVESGWPIRSGQMFNGGQNGPGRLAASRSVSLVLGIVLIAALLGVAIFEIRRGGTSSSRGILLLSLLVSAFVLALILQAGASIPALALRKRVSKLEPHSLTTAVRLGVSSRVAYGRLALRLRPNALQPPPPISLALAASSDGLEFWRGPNPPERDGSAPWATFKKVTVRELKVWPLSYPMLRLELVDGSSVEFIVISTVTRGAVRSGVRRVRKLAEALDAMRASDSKQAGV